MRFIVELNEQLSLSTSILRNKISKSNGHSILQRLDEYRTEYTQCIEESIGQVIQEHPDLGSNYRWLAFVYKSSVLGRLIFNEPISLFPDDETRQKFLSAQSLLFYWYEAKAASGSICSLFRVVMNEEFKNIERPFFGLLRSPNVGLVNRELNESFIDISDLFTAGFLNHYHQMLLEVAGNLNNDQAAGFKLVDDIVEIACNSVLSTSEGRRQIKHIKYRLSEVTENLSVVRRPDHDLLAALFCLAVVDPEWTHYYYLPFFRSTPPPYAALAIASHQELDTTRFSDFFTRPVLHLFLVPDQIEDRLHKNAKQADERIEELLARYAGQIGNNPELLTQAKKEFTTHFEQKLATNVLISVSGDLEAEVGPTGRVSGAYVDIDSNSNVIQIRRNVPPITAVEIPDVLRDFERILPVWLGIRKPFRADLVTLHGWLDVDIVDSTKLFSRLSEFSRGSVSTIASEIYQYFGKHIIGSGAMKTAETPDGWMCGFEKAEEAVRAACRLIVNLGALNDILSEKLSRETVQALAGGIAIRIGVHSSPYPVLVEGELNQETGDTLNYTGHFQKKGGEKYAIAKDAIDERRPSRGGVKEDIAWVVTFGADAHRILQELSDSQTYRSAVNFSQLQSDHFSEETIDNQPVHIYGRLKTEPGVFEEIDSVIQVDDLVCDFDRTYPYIKNEASYVVKLICNQMNHFAEALKCLDIGSGSGIYAFCLARAFANSQVTAVEPNNRAREVWLSNKDLLIESMRSDFHERCTLLEGEFGAVVPSLDKDWDVVVFNLPYVPADRPQVMFSHSDGGENGLAVISEVLDWLDSEEMEVRHIVFPCYSLCKSDGWDTSLIKDYLSDRTSIVEKYDIKSHCAGEFFPNWYVLRYNDSPTQHCVPLQVAFPEIRRRRDVAEWVYKLREHGWSHILHCVVELVKR